MIKTIEFEGQKVELNTSAGWLFAYKNRFGHDIFPDLMPIIESVVGALASLLESGETELNAGNVKGLMDDDTITDAFIKLAGMEITTVYQVLWAMAYNADKSIGGPEDFFNSFERFPLDVIIPELFTAIVESSVSSKNGMRLLKALKNLRQSD